jgi:hypothetical protein
MEKDTERTAGSARIPLSLQAVFVNGSRGHAVNAPPPDASAMKTFRGSRWRPLRSWSMQVSRNTTTGKDAVELLDTTKKPTTRAQKMKRSKVSHARCWSFHYNKKT